MSLTKEECWKALEDSRILEVVVRGEEGNVEYYSNFEDTVIFHLFEQLINEHFDNTPLKFEELKKGMLVWDKNDNKYNKIIEINNDVINFYYVTNSPTRFTCKFEENRFYRYEVKDDEV